ncbi:MAG TPA: indolepyruvate oxidoreductase subunit beta [Deltaproteobacteria bacterium]|nr:indolepyruvate oxidoreductase subunit beta [Deltaproteobacteria bacterium]HOM27903.1 indolepyruvate oxidoreductase subunit beta [Deltaproteobacteria bacterium]HPP79425.1 indolepyruvate oxidoreductase subunit beta [Deltaproteobacteria bacterium]
MAGRTLSRDPFSVIVTGVGGQGNVTASRLIASMLVAKGYVVTVGETFGASQRGGSVMSHVRISACHTYSPQVPKCRADVVVSLEPTETIRVLASYGHPETRCVVNDRPVYPVRVIAGEVEYPGIEEIDRTIAGLCRAHVMIGATSEALRLGNPVLQNVIMIGALQATGLVPFTRADFEGLVSAEMAPATAELNLEAFDAGVRLAEQAMGGKAW